MKYTYSGKKKSEIIEKYTIENDKIIVYFLDGHKEEYLYNKITEDSIKLRMIEQATEFVLNDKTVRQLSFYATVFYPGWPLIALLFLSDASESALKNATYFFLGWMVIGTAHTLVFAPKIKDRRDYTEKYEIYLKNRKEIEKYSLDSCLYDGVDKQDLNINTLDNYTLGEVTRISRNVNTCRSKEKTYLKIISYVYKHINNPELFKDVIEDGEVTVDNVDSIVNNLPLDKVKTLKLNISNIIGEDL